MKKFIVSLYMSLTVCALSAQIPAGNFAPGTMPELPPLSQEEMKILDEIFENLDPETLDALAKIGEEYIQEELKQGRDPFAIFNQPEQSTPPAQAVKPVQPVAPEQPVVTNIVDSKTVEQLRDLLRNLRNHIISVRQRAESSRHAQQKLAAWKYTLDDIVYYTHVLAQEKLIKYLADKDFEQLLRTFRTLDQELAFLEPMFQVREINIEEETPYSALGLTPTATVQDIQSAYQTVLEKTKPDGIKKALADKPADVVQDELKKASQERSVANQAYAALMAQEQAYQALDNMLESFNKAVYTNKMIDDIKNLLKRYEPEALKIKEDQEKRESAARKEQEELIKRRPSFVPPTQEPKYDRPGSTSRPSTPSRSGDGRTPFIPTGEKSERARDRELKSSKLPEKEGSPKKINDAKKSKDDKGDDKKDKKEKEEKSSYKIPPAHKKLEEKVVPIEKLFKDLASKIEEEPILPTASSPKDLLKNFDEYLTQPIPTPYSDDSAKDILSKAKQINDTLLKLTEQLNKIKKELRSSLKELTPSEKRTMRNAIAQIHKKYYDSHLKKHLPTLVTIHLNPEKTLINVKEVMQPIAPDKQFLHFGTPVLDESDATNKPLLDINKDRIAFIPLFIDTYKALVDELKEKK
jgi:hypothetical protein